jgi:hypothetical protein
MKVKDVRVVDCHIISVPLRWVPLNTSLFYKAFSNFPQENIHCSKKYHRGLFRGGNLN